MATSDATPTIKKRTRAASLACLCETCGVQFIGHSYRQNACGVACRFKLYQNAGAATDCWPWNGPRNNAGYGVLFLDQNHSSGKRKVVSAHRHSFALAGGVLTAEKPCVMHACDNRQCTNPAHLSAGSWADNNADRSKKGRSGVRSFSQAELDRYSLINRGSGNNSAKLTEQQVHEIRASKTGCVLLSRIYGVSKASIVAVRTRRTWAHV